MSISTLYQYLKQPVDIAPLVSFRLLFGLLGMGGLIWSIAKGDIQKRYWEPNFFFDYYGFEWLPYLGDIGIVVVYFVAIVAALGVFLGLFYRYALALFALSFSYLHTVDATNFINHYYLIWVLSVYLFLSPANRAFSLDIRRGASVELGQIPRYYLLVFQIQLAIVYTFAGLAKLNSDWIFKAMPMKIWLLQHSDFPLLGAWFKENWVHYAASWGAVVYDLSIAFWLFWPKTRVLAYLVVLLFHLFTWALFDIGLFPPLMIIATLLFFSPDWHRKLQQGLAMPGVAIAAYGMTALEKWKIRFLLIFISFQLLIPCRHWFLGGRQLAWRQEYMRYGWRVMLVEHEGLAQIKVYAQSDQRIWEVDPRDFLTAYQIKRMSVQPEHLRQFAHYLAEEYQARYQLEERPAVRAKLLVSMNGRLSRPLVDPQVDLAQEPARWTPQPWILDQHKNN